MARRRAPRGRRRRGSRGAGRSASWLKMHYGALLFLYGKTLGRPNDVSFISWPRAHSPLPEIASVEEVDALLRALTRAVDEQAAMEARARADRETKLDDAVRP